ncbi:hypothetical protein ON010_g5433 [Phytophthora cinnamomi]|nr:hypothetical protein ON010_g5433 [Phytophthora cinnamomi]
MLCAIQSSTQAAEEEEAVEADAARGVVVGTTSDDGANPPQPRSRRSGQPHGRAGPQEVGQRQDLDVRAVAGQLLRQGVAGGRLAERWQLALAPWRQEPQEEVRQQRLGLLVQVPPAAV